MRKPVGLSCALSLFLLASCSHSPVARALHGRGADGWVSRLDKGEVKKEFDTNGDGRPDLVRIYKNDQLVRVERDRNFDGKPDLIQEYDRGILVREIHDDDFDGKPETIKTFRAGNLAIVERDPQERGQIDIAEYYDDNGNLIRRVVRTAKGYATQAAK